jgi:tagaturonate epimerase
MVETIPVGMHPGKTGLLNKKIEIEGINLYFNEFTLLKAVIKYGQAILHIVSLYRHLLQNVKEGVFELEVSVDETDHPTSHAEHYYIASELKRQGVKWVSLAPRFIGRFEKGVDYIGDPSDFEKDITGHAAISRVMGPYKLSLHSGSDKFSIYEPAMHQTQGLIHLKTAGTSYLEALRTIAETDPMLFHEIYEFAREKYAVDRTSYHVSAELIRAPAAEKGSDWASVLEQFDAREILHVTFGSVLTEMLSTGQSRFKERIMANLVVNADLYAENIKKHFIRHLSPFCRVEK